MLSSRAKSLIVAGLVLMAFSLWAWSCRGFWTRYYYTRFRGGDPAKMYVEREARLNAIWDSLCRFHGQMGRFPSSVQEWASIEPQLELLLAPPSQSTGAYTFVASGFDGAHEAVVIQDPGTTWPGFDPDSRIVTMWPDLFNNGSIGKILNSGEVVRWTDPQPCDSHDGRDQ